MIQIFGGIPGVIVYFDDICVVTENEEEHDRLLSIVLERARANNVRFNPEKIQYRAAAVQFMAHVLEQGRIRSGGKCREAILSMKRPQGKSEVMRLLGLFKYLGKFIPNLSGSSSGLRDLTRNGVEFEWTGKHESELNDLLATITADPVLVIYDPAKPVIVQTDASKDGLGCVIMQDGHPIAYASRTLSKSEQRWAEIEKQLLAIVFACQRFHFYLYGREFTVESDHRPLETLVKRDIDNVTARLQRMFMSLLRYPKMNVVYKPGKEMLVADCLSRAQLPEVEENIELSEFIHSVTKSACLSKENYDLYRKTLQGDEKYSRICDYVMGNWPSFHKMDEFGQAFYKFRDELLCENGVPFWNHRLVIPGGLQENICKWLHAPHLGIEKTLARARMDYFWPDMSRQIRELVTACTVCEPFRRNQQKEPLTQGSPAEFPFQRASTDLYEYAGHDYIVVIDAYSGLVISEPVRNKTVRHIVEILSNMFNRLGYPALIRCDNSPFGSAEFERFAEESNIELRFSSPRYPQSNGLAEKGMAIVKNILKRCYEMRWIRSNTVCLSTTIRRWRACVWRRPSCSSEG